jgi:hypothetical protein
MTNSTRSTRSSGRTAALVAGTAIGIVAVSAVAGGAALVGVHASKRDHDGYYASGRQTLATPTYALVADKLDVDGRGAGWLFRRGRLGTVRITARGTPQKPVFVGIAPSSKVAGYLRGVAQDEVTDLEVDPLSVSYHRRAGTSVPPAPGTQSFWTARAGGSGVQTVTWPVQQGDWVVVVMNADGTPGVETGVTVGAKTGILGWIGALLLAFGGVLGIAAGICYRGARRRPAAADAGVAGAVPVTP